MQRPTSEILLGTWISILISKNPQNWYSCRDIQILNRFQAQWTVQPEFHHLHLHIRYYFHYLKIRHLHLHIRYCFHYHLNFHVEWLPVFETGLVFAFLGKQKQQNPIHNYRQMKLTLLVQPFLLILTILLQSGYDRLLKHVLLNYHYFQVKIRKCKTLDYALILYDFFWFYIQHICHYTFCSHTALFLSFVYMII